MRRDRCGKSVNQFIQKGQIIRTGADERRSFQASLVPSFFISDPPLGSLFS